jgi:FkbM family methyltransferase
MFELRSTLLEMLRSLRQRYHPLWHLRRSRFYPVLDRIFNFTLYARIDGVSFLVALRFLRDFSWIAGSANLEPATNAFLKRFLAQVPIHHFWDIGANIGCISWKIRTQLPDCDLLLVEPDPLNADLIELTIQKNSIKRVTVLRCALTNENGLQSFTRDRVSGATGRLGAVDVSDNLTSIQGTYAMHNHQKIDVKTRTLDSLLGDGLKAPDLIKVDVEGAEWLVLSGGKELFAKGVFGLIEIHDKLVFDLMDSYGYDSWLVDSDAQNYFVAPRGRLDVVALMEDLGIERHSFKIVS